VGVAEGGALVSVRGVVEVLPAVVSAVRPSGFSPEAVGRTGDSSPAGDADGTPPDPNSCKPPPSPVSLSDPSSGLPPAGLSPADSAAAAAVGVGGVGGGEPFVGDALLKAKAAVSVLGLAAAGPDGIGPLLRFCVESADKKGGGDCAVGRDAAAALLLPGGAALVVVWRAPALTGASLRPLGARDGQNLAVCLVGGGDESRGGSTRGNEEEEPMTVWASVAGWRMERRKPRRRRAMSASGVVSGAGGGSLHRQRC